MDGAKTQYRHHRHVLKNIVVNRRFFCLEVFSRERMEQEEMRILAGVGSNFVEKSKISKG